MKTRRSELPFNRERASFKKNLAVSWKVILNLALIWGAIWNSMTVYVNVLVPLRRHTEQVICDNLRACRTAFIYIVSLFLTHPGCVLLLSYTCEIPRNYGAFCSYSKSIPFSKRTLFYEWRMKNLTGISKGRKCRCACLENESKNLPWVSMESGHEWTRWHPSESQMRLSPLTL